MFDPADALARVRRPEYTGDNRCLPCTALNLVLAVGVAVLAVELWSGTTGVAVLGVSLLAIYFRGYLVPGTPRITALYFPERVLRWFGKADSEDTFRDTDTATRELLRAGVLERDRRDGTLRPASDFRESVLRHARDSSPTADDVAEALGVAEVVSHGDESFVLDGNRLVKWESQAALVADVATAAELRTRFDGWSELDDEERSELLATARAFVPNCPDCGGQVSVERRRADSCCRQPYTVVRSTCSDCGTPLLETTVRDDDPEWLDALAHRT